MKKTDPREEVSPKTQVDSSSHLTMLEGIIIETLQANGRSIPFGLLGDRLKHTGYKRNEVIAAIDKLYSDGVIGYFQEKQNSTYPHPVYIQLYVKLTGGEV